MNVHKNARLTAHSRADLARRVVDHRQPRKSVAAAYGVDPKTVDKWVHRYLAHGLPGLADRSSRPHRLRKPTSDETRQQIISLRKQRFTGQHIANQTKVSPATVSRVLRSVRLSRVKDLEPPQPVIRYQREHPGDMIHLDIKKLGRFEKPGHRVTKDRTNQSTARGKRGGESWGAGWEFVHVCIDDASRIAFSQIMPDEKSQSAVPFLKAALAYYASLGVTVSRVMTDNGSCYKSFAFRDACKELKIKHVRTRPYTPKTNGKAERFIQTALREWAYAQSYQAQIAEPTNCQAGSTDTTGIDLMAA